jgi:5'-3' exonuclease
MTQPIPKSIALVDFSHMLVVNFKGRANDAGPNDAGQATINQLYSIANTVERVVVCLDKKPYWRTGIFPDYKKGRVREPELVNIWSWTMERLAADGFQMAHAAGEEADDVAATLAAAYAGLGCTDVRIVTQDKDVAQCITDSVRVYAPIQGKSGEFEIRDAAWLASKYEVTPANFALLLAIMGDTSDNIPGIKGLGQKIGAKLINNYHTPKGMAEACVRAVEAANIDGKLPDFWKKYADGMAQLPTWLRLTTLNTKAELNKPPLELLEKLPATKLVEESDLPGDELTEEEAEALAELDKDEMPADEAWSNGPTAEELAAEAAVMADATGAPAMVTDNLRRERVADNIQESDPKLRKDRAAALALADRVISPPKAAPIIGKDPGADAALQKLGEENAAHAQQTKSAAQLRQERAAAMGPKAPASVPPPSASPADAAASPASPPTGGAAGVVPSTQGPPKPAPGAKPPRAGDEIPEEEALARVPVAAPNWALAAQPMSANAMLAIAKVLFNSRLFADFGSERGVFAVMALGRELGLGYAESLESFFIVKNRPFPKAKWILSRMQKHPDCEWCVITAADEKAATIKAKHKKFPDILSITYTIEMAEQAGHTTGPNRHNWEKNTRSMLRARAISAGCGDWFPGATFAMHSVEEALDNE